MIKDNQVYDLHQDDEYAGIRDGVYGKAEREMFASRAISSMDAPMP